MMDRPLRIVHCANFSARKYGAVYYSTDRKISNGLIRNGHFVEEFSYRDIATTEAPLRLKRLGIDKMNAKLLEMLQRIRPDILLLGHSEMVSNDTLRAARAALPEMKIAQWWVDWIDGLRVKQDFFIERIDMVDDFFLTTDPQALKDFLPLDKTLERIHFMPNMCDASIDTGRAFECAHPRHDLLFIGRDTGFPERKDFIAFLESEMGALNVGLYGQSRDRLVFGHDYIALLSACPMAINHSHKNDTPLYSSDRMVHLAANGCLVFTPKTPKMEQVFSTDEVVYFGGLTELREKALYYLAHKDEARAIAQAGHHRAHQDYDCQTVTAQMLRAIAIK
jgi:hypothetical protein